MCQFLKNTKTRIDTGKNTRHDMGKTRTRYGDTNILKLHELYEKCVNFYKTPKHKLTQKKIHGMTRKKYEHDTDTRIVRSNSHRCRISKEEILNYKIKLLIYILIIFSCWFKFEL